MATTKKYVYFFGAGKAEGKGTQRELLGGKGAGLAAMSNLGLPVPAGFTITTECCELYFKNDKKWPAGLEKQIRTALAKLEKVCGKKFGDTNDPLLVSVRSGAAISMPGMMETILNIGLNDESLDGLARASNNRRFALDAYRRLIMMYASTAMGVERDKFEQAFEQLKNNVTRLRIGKPAGQSVLDIEVNEQELEELIPRFKQIYRESTGRDFPQDPYEQLIGAINAVFDSWMGEKAVKYRQVEGITGLKGTACNVQQMVFGNRGDDSGTGVCFTRDPSTGENVFYGDLLINAQGEDVVAGVRTPVKLQELAEKMPEVYDQLCAVRAILETHYGDMQDLEFTVENGKLYMLQTRRGKRSPTATFRIAVEQATKPLLSRTEANRLVKKGYLPKSVAAKATKPVITKQHAIARIAPEDIERLFYPVIDPNVPGDELEHRRIASGINAVPGAACGQVVFTAGEAEQMAARGEKVILVRKETSPEDVGGMHAAVGILTATGGPTSHAAVVARGWGKCCIVGCEALNIDYNTKQMSVNSRVIRQGDYITLDGSEGAVYEGQLPLSTPELPSEYYTLMGWCDKLRRLKVRTNADTPYDAAKAIEMGAEGIGLCRTEHMFFDTEERRLAIQEMIVAESEAARRRALDKLLPFQRDDFADIFGAMAGKPVIIRLIDPPLHEFLPRTEEDRRKLSERTGVPVEQIQHRAEQLHEANPMLGHRGCRLCITYPEILEMQVRAIMEAAVACTQRGIKVIPEIMIPLSIDAKELAILTERARGVADAVLREAGVKLRYMVGTMIETPRAALLADKVAQVAEFFSFGTNDLTQTVMAISRDDSGRFLPEYVDEKRAAIFSRDPFQSLDQEGVGMLIEWAIRQGRKSRPKLEVGICGEHGGEAESVKFCHRVGMDYVSCSPYRVPIARLAAAQAAIEDAAGRKKPQRTSRAASTRAAATRAAKVKKATTAKAAKARKVPKAAAKKRARRR